MGSTEFLLHMWRFLIIKLISLEVFFLKTATSNCAQNICTQLQTTILVKVLEKRETENNLDKNIFNSIPHTGN